MPIRSEQNGILHAAHEGGGGGGAGKGGGKGGIYLVPELDN